MDYDSDDGMFEYQFDAMCDLINAQHPPRKIKLEITFNYINGIIIEHIDPKNGDEILNPNEMSRPYQSITLLSGWLRQQYERYNRDRERKQHFPNIRIWKDGIYEKIGYENYHQSIGSEFLAAMRWIFDGEVKK